MPIWEVWVGAFVAASGGITISRRWRYLPGHLVVDVRLDSRRGGFVGGAVRDERIRRPTA